MRCEDAIEIRTKEKKPPSSLNLKARVLSEPQRFIDDSDFTTWKAITVALKIEYGEPEMFF